MARPPRPRASAASTNGSGGRGSGNGNRNGNGDAAGSSSIASSSSRKPRQPPPAKQIVEIETTDDDNDDNDDEEALDMEEVDVSAPVTATGTDDDDAEVEMEMEDVEIDRADQEQGGGMADYAAVHQEEPPGDTSADAASGAATPASVPVYYDGKGQHKGASLSLTFDQRPSDTESAKKKKRTNVLTPRDRAVRLDGHKLHVMALLAHAKVRNRWLNHEGLRDLLYCMTPSPLRQKLRSIHPKKVESQRERVRLFESFMSDLVRWWAVRFYLEPNVAAASAIRQPNGDVISGNFPRPGRRVDGWVVESSKQRDRRHDKEAKAQSMRQKQASEALSKLRGEGANNSSRINGRAKGKGKAKEANVPLINQQRLPQSKRKQTAPEIAIFPPGSDTTLGPTFFRLLSAPEPIRSADGLIGVARKRSGSRETSAQLFCALCRALGIPARLVISPQVGPWSIGAGKVAQTTGAVDEGPKRKGKRKLPARTMQKATDDDTSDDFEFAEAIILNGDEESDVSSVAGPSSSKGTPKKASRGRGAPRGSASRPVSIASGTASGDEKPLNVAASGKIPPNKRAKNGKKPSSRGQTKEDALEIDDEEESKGSLNVKNGSKGKKKKQSKDDESEEDYRDEKWKGVTGPIEIEHKPKLRLNKPAPKENALEADEIEDVDAIDLSSPPTMWVEVFSKPYQRWLTIDPIRAKVIPTGNRQMEPLPYDRTNKLVYVMAFEEDGYARDVTARYTKTLFSRVSKMRPPPSRRDGDWWEGVVRSLQRPQRLERDAVEDAELQESSSKEPMPSSVGGFKDHPVFALERHLKRDETIHPYTQVGLFQGIPVFRRQNVLTLRSARQWYNEGRVVTEGEQALKWVKSRGYTLNSRRAEEQAKADGGEELQEGLYARHQTQLYRAPPVQDGIVPTNHFGNIDLFVPSMLPEGAVHIPYSGTAKVARKLQISHAEAIVGFEFRKHRSMPKMAGIVVAEEHEETVLDAYWESESAAREKEERRREERALRGWRRLINALRIAKRVQSQYGKKKDGAHQDEGEAQYSSIHEPTGGEDEDQNGGFLLGDEDETQPEQQSEEEPAPRSRMALKLDKYSRTARSPDQQGKQLQEEHEPEANPGVTLDEPVQSQDYALEQPSSSQMADTPMEYEGPIVSLADLASAQQGRRRQEPSGPASTTSKGGQASTPKPGQRSNGVGRGRKRPSSPPATDVPSSSAAADASADLPDGKKRRIIIRAAPMKKPTISLGPAPPTRAQQPTVQPQPQPQPEPAQEEPPSQISPATTPPSRRPSRGRRSKQGTTTSPPAPQTSETTMGTRRSTRRAVVTRTRGSLRERDDDDDDEEEEEEEVEG